MNRLNQFPSLHGVTVNTTTGYWEGVLLSSAEASSSGPNVCPQLTFKLLEPLVSFSRLQDCAPALLS